MANTTGMKFGGRKKGTSNKKSRYVTIHSILSAIEDQFGKPYQDLLVDLLQTSLTKYELNEDPDTYPKLMMHLSNKLIEQARTIPEDTQSDLESLTTEELEEKHRQVVIDYINQYGVPNE